MVLTRLKLHCQSHHSAVGQPQEPSASALAVFLCLSMVAIYVFSDRITRPVKRLTAQAKTMSQGLLDQSMPVYSRDEIGQLTTTFNDMARALKDLYSGAQSGRTHRGINGSQ